jgi:predicted nucleotidyltransferase
MQVSTQDRARLEAETLRLVEQLKAMGAVQIILFGSLVKEHISLFSDIDLLVLFDRVEPAHELTRWVYRNIDAGEAVDIVAYDRQAFQQVRDRPFFRKILSEGKVLHGPAS